MTILVDEAYEEANQRAAQRAGLLVMRRFADVYGDAEGSRVLTDIKERMEANIRSDGRSESGSSQNTEKREVEMPG